MGHPGRSTIADQLNAVIGVTLRSRKAAEPWAILRRHPLGTEVGEHSVNPCLVTASETWSQAVNTQLRGPSSAS